MFSFVISYLIWHYTTAFSDLWRHLRNFLWFFYHFFSIPVLLKTFFAPWRRLGEQYPKGINIAEFLSVFLINTLMRIVGVVTRLGLIIFGVAMLALTFVFGIGFFVIWALLPIIAVVIVLSGLRLLFL